MRNWFVPIGRDLEPLISWVPMDLAQLASQDLLDSTKGVPLSQPLAGVATAVEQAFRQGVGTTAKSSERTATRTSLSNWRNVTPVAA